jgi:hypothetical protein
MTSDRGAAARRRALVIALASLTAIPVAAGAAQTRVHEPPPSAKRPPDGARYTGTHRLMLQISGKQIEIVSFRFPCKTAKGDTSITGIPVTKAAKGYKFSIETNGIVTYTDSATHPDQNGMITFAGQFGRLAKTVKGHFRVKTPRCDSGRIDFSGQREP